ncbi:MAG: lamin tail domain-containing protein, partial [Verrucomicrobiota bacterium]
MKTHLFHLVISALLVSGVSAAPVLSEFMARNNSGLTDQDGETSDWIEIHNPDAAPVSLDGYALTDDAEDNAKWVFPAVSIESGGRLLVFASRKDRKENELHASFSLSGGGEYLALIDPSGRVVSEFAPAYPEQKSDISYGLYEGSYQFFKTPTPEAANDPGILGFVEDTKFSINRGFYDEAFDLEITTATEGATISYSVDGSDPSKGTIFRPAKTYTGPIRIDSTTVIRAVAKKPNYESTDTDTHSYIFLDSIIEQPTDPEGYPSSWKGTRADYEMDPDITSTVSREEMRESLRSLPTVCFTSKIDDLFGSNGIYANPESKGIDWEIPTSFEWIEKDGSTAFHIDCGLRIQGGYFRGASATQKHSFRVLFKEIYGAGSLNHDIFQEPGAVQSFETMVFRAGANDGYSWNAAKDTEQFTRDEFGRRLLLDMGQPSPRGTFVHLYLNGIYWGLHNLTERPNEDFSSAYMGGEPEEWDAVNSGEVKNGSLGAWNDMKSQIRNLDGYGSWMKLQGRDANGTPNPSFDNLFDVDNYCDYMVANLWGGNWDWPNKNFWFGRKNGPESTGFKFYTWDFENTMGNNRGRSPLNMKSPRNLQWVGEPHGNLMKSDYDEYYRVAYSDSVQRHFFNGGLLTPDVLVERYRVLAEGIEKAILAETARWGDDHHSTPQDLSDWIREKNWMLNTYLPQRSAIVLQQFKDDKLFPSVDAPVFNQHGGSITPGFMVEITRPTSSVFYTMDGSDPYDVNLDSNQSEVRDTAMEYDAPFTLTDTTTVKARYFKQSIFGARTWSALSEATFVIGTDNLVLEELMYQPAAPTEDEIAAGYISASDFEYLVLKNSGDSVAHLDGLRFSEGINHSFAGGTVEPGASVVIVRNQAAFEMRYGSTHSVVGEYDGRLNNGGERVVLNDAAGKMLVNFVYDDQAPWPIGESGADGGGASLKLASASVGTDYSDPSLWTNGAALSGGEGPAIESLTAWLAANGLTVDGDPDDDGLTNLIEYTIG